MESTLVNESLEQAKALGLENWEMLSSILETELVCNGIGPEWFPPSLRQLIDKLNPTLKLAAMIHDMHYYNGVGCQEDFLEANRIFEENGRKLADATYGPWNPLRYWVRHKAKIFRKACDEFGWSAYDNAIRQRLASMDF